MLILVLVMHITIYAEKRKDIFFQTLFAQHCIVQMRSFISVM